MKNRPQSSSEASSKSLAEDFSGPLSPTWTRTTVGTGYLKPSPEALGLHLSVTATGTYSDAQIDDYGHLPRAQFPWQPPVRMTIRGRASHPAAASASESSKQTAGTLRGTAGFGFWNYPFSVRGDVLMLPEAVWFFYASPPSNMALVPDSPGFGWKAQVVHAMRSGTLFSALPLLGATPLAWLTGNTRPAAHWLQRVTGAHETTLEADLATWHTYKLEWETLVARFYVDEELVLTAPNPPTRPLGFVAWLDNQYAIATPRGALRFGTVSSTPQWLEIASLRIEPL